MLYWATITLHVANAVVDKHLHPLENHSDHVENAFTDKDSYTVK